MQIVSYTKQRIFYFLSFFVYYCTGFVKIVFANLEAYELPVRIQSSNRSCSATHKWVKDNILLITPRLYMVDYQV